MTAPAIQRDPNGLKARYATPDTTPEEGWCGGIWTRTFPKRCAQCGDTYFTWIEQNDLQQPYRVDPEPEPDKNGYCALRGTCGSPICEERERAHQWRRSPAVISTMERYWAAVNQTHEDKPKKGGLQRNDKVNLTKALKAPDKAGKMDLWEGHEDSRY